MTNKLEIFTYSKVKSAKQYPHLRGINNSFPSAFVVPVKEFCLESGQIQDIAVQTSEINCEVKGQSQDHDSKSLYFKLWDLVPVATLTSALVVPQWKM